MEKGLKEYFRSPEAREAALCVEGQLKLSPDLLEKSQIKSCEDSVRVTVSLSSTTILEEPFSNLLNTQLPQWSCLVSEKQKIAPMLVCVYV